MAAGHNRSLDRVDRVRILVLSRARWRAVCVIEIRRARPGGLAGTRTGAADPGQRGGAGRHDQYRPARLDDTPDRARRVAARIPLNVALSGEDHAWAFVFLASDRSRGITGEIIRPDGGFGLGAKAERK
jgi:NAD(P)-dependent dehydrogenase (short-subunit alcohol dehydrogenase family)